MSPRPYGPAFAIGIRCIAIGVSVLSVVAHGQTDVLQRARVAEAKRIAVIERALPASISVFSPTGRGGGSGVIINPDGYALTNYHVVKPCGNYMHCSTPDGNLYDAVLVGLDPTGDVALIKLQGRDDFPAAIMGDSDRLNVGDYVFAVGNPFLLATDFQPTVTWGIVSGLHRYQYPSGTLLEYADCIQTDAAINPGNSGGPLFNARAELVGVNGRASFEKRGRVNVGVGYAISVNQIKLFIEQLQSGRIVDHATLGATASADAQGRIVVDNILQNSDAHRRGLRHDDQIVSIAGRQISTINQLKNILGIYPKGWRVPLVYRREGTDYKVVVRLAGVHSPQELVELVERTPKPDPQQMPEPAKIQRSEVKIPQKVADQIESRSGFANYYFNRVQAERIWDRFLDSYGSTTVQERWQISGTLADGTDLTVILSPHDAGMRWGEQSVVLDIESDLSSQIAQGEAHEILAGLYLWHRLVTQGPGSYGDVYYLGDLPFGSQLARQDVLVATYDVTETNFFFDKATSALLGMEAWTDIDSDPCEIVFDQFRSHGQVSLPHRLIARTAGGVKWVIAVEKYSITPTER